VIRWALLLLATLGCAHDRTDEVDLSRYPRGLDAREAPMLAKLVDEGKLPPVDERLPENPLVARDDYGGYEGPGQYGGTWHRMHAGPLLADWKMVGGYPTYVRWRPDCSGLDPGLAESWEFNEDGTVLTLHLRKGVRWSDGHPFTSESFAFFYQLCLDDRHRYVPPVWCLVNGKPMEVETPDDYTIVMKFAGPNWTVPTWLASYFRITEKYNIPKHYMIQFHPDYNPEFKDFTVFQKKNLTHLNEERPTLWPWRILRRESAGFRVILERNPYYYVVDKLGRQLPYIDRVVSNFRSNYETIVLRILAGEIDCQIRNTQLSDLSLFLRGAERGGYTVRKWEKGGGAQPSILLNWSAPDPVLRELIRDQRFRKALALGVDREKVNEIAWRGLLQPQGATVSEESWHFKDPEGQALFEEWKRADSEFNLDKANALLDEMGLDRRDKEGYRLRPDGQRLTIMFDVPIEHRQLNDTGIIVAEDWRKLGLDIVLNVTAQEEVDKRQRLGEYTISEFSIASEIDIYTFPDWVFPTTFKYWHPKVGHWYQTGGKKGEAPTGVMKRLLDIYEEGKQQKDFDKRNEYIREAVRIHIDEGPFHIGTVGRAPALVIVGNHFHNVPETGILGPWAVVNPASSFPEQYYMDDKDAGD